MSYLPAGMWTHICIVLPLLIFMYSHFWCESVASSSTYFNVANGLTAVGKPVINPERNSRDVMSVGCQLAMTLSENDSL